MVGPVPTIEHEPWWSEIEWLCAHCAATRRTQPASWPMGAPQKVGEYEILGYVDSGGMAAIFEGRHVRAGIRAAIKLLFPERSVDPRRSQRFVKEQRILSKMDHPLVVRCLDVGVASGWLYVAMEFLSFGHAERLMQNRADVRAIVNVCADMFEALAYAHNSGVIHRDVKPSNLLLFESEGRVRGKLSDFGLAKNVRTMGGTFVTDSREIGGSAAFVAPEQLTGFKRVGPSADVYAAGVSLYHMLTKALPVVLPCEIEDATDPQMCLATLSHERVPIARHRPDLHPFLAQWIDTLVQRDDAVRAHLDAATVAATLRAYPGA